MHWEEGMEGFWHFTYIQTLWDLRVFYAATQLRWHENES